MGGVCGGGGTVAPAKEEAAPAGLSQAEKDRIAVQALKDALNLAVEYAIETGTKTEIWEGRLKIVIPVQKEIDEAKAKALAAELPKVGPIGGGKIPGMETLCEGIDKMTAPFEQQFKDAAMAVFSAPGTKNKYTVAVTDLSVDKAIDLCRSGGPSACVEHLLSKTEQAITRDMKVVVDGIMEGHPLTAAWKEAIAKFNEMAKLAEQAKIDIKPIEFDLNSYVLEQTLNGMKTLMMEKEAEIRKAPSAAVSSAIKCVFGGVDPNSWKS